MPVTIDYEGLVADLQKRAKSVNANPCLLYTSDAADEQCMV